MAVIDITKQPYLADNTYSPTTNRNAASASDALQNAILSSPDKSRSLKILIPFGKYKFDKTVRITRSVIIEGEGGGQMAGMDDSYGATQIFPEPGVTPFQFWRGGVSNSVLTQNANGAPGSEIRDLEIISDPARNDTSTISGDYDKDRRELNLTGDLSKWSAHEAQLIAIPGAGYTVDMSNTTASFKMKRIFSGTTEAIIFDKDSIRIDPLSHRGQIDFDLNGNYRGVYIGAYIAFVGLNIKDDEPAKVTKIVLGPKIDDPAIQEVKSITVDLSEAKINDIKSRINSGNNDQIDLTNFMSLPIFEMQMVCELITRVVDVRNSGQLLLVDMVGNQSPKNVTIRHADAGVDIGENAVRCRNLAISGMEGPGIAIIANPSTHDEDPNMHYYSNADDFRVDTCIIANCGFGIYIYGVDANAGLTTNVQGLQNHLWSIADFSGSNNTHVTLSTDGGFGAINRSGSTFVGTYFEEGTGAYFGPATTSVGGAEVSEYGGWSWVGGTFNRFNVGETDGSARFSSYRRYFYPTMYLEAYKSNTSQFDYQFLKTIDGNGAAGWYAHVYQGSGIIPFCWSDSDAEGGAAQFWAPGGIQLGRNTNKLLHVDSKRTITYGNGPVPTAIDNPKNGDIVFNFSAAVGSPVGWIYVELIDPQDSNQNHWREFGQIK
jgi:hypothetical protein